MTFAAFLAISAGSSLDLSAQGYRHEVHSNAGVTLRCEGCHGGSADGKIELPGKDQHKPCSNRGCHAADFRKRDSNLCISCHEHNEPWRANPLKTTFDGPGEFFVAFSHQSHDKRMRNDKSSCGSCHPNQAGNPPRAPEKGFLVLAHKDCSTCHAEFAKPAMTDCGGCHKLESTSKAPEGNSTDPRWRVAAKFRHETHRTDPRNNGVQDCRSCHGDVLTVAAGERIPRPSMQGCAEGCHDGTVAFKATGFNCSKCHGPNLPTGRPASSPMSSPASQPR